MPNGKPDDAERSPETLLALGPNWRDGDQPAVSSCDRIGRLCRGRGHSRRVGDRSMGSRLKEWRRERDSNPRYGFPYTRFPSVRLKPLGHLSGWRGT